MKKVEGFHDMQRMVQTPETVNGRPIYIKPQFNQISASVSFGQALTEPFWCVRKMDAMPEEGNMELITLTSEGHATTFGNSKSKSVQTLGFSTPCLTNTMELKPGDELVWASPQPEAKKKAMPLKMKETKKRKKDEMNDEL